EQCMVHPFDVDCKEVDPLSGRHVLREQIVQCVSRQLHCPDQLCPVKVQTCLQPGLADCIECREVKHVERPLRSRNNIDARLHIDVSWTKPSEQSHCSRVGINVQSPPPALIEVVGVGEPNGVIRSDVHIETIAHAVE